MIPREKVHIQVDDTTIEAGNPGLIIHPVWWLATIYDGPVAYEQSLKQFSRSQRLVFAVRCYLNEVENGGHRQFYSNSTGIVWIDAMEGFEALGLPQAASIIRISADRMGGSPSLDRGERKEQLIAHKPEFADLDKALYELREKVSLNELIMKFIRAQPADFYFSGTIERVKLPGR